MPCPCRAAEDDIRYLPAPPSKSTLSSTPLTEDIYMILGRLNSHRIDMKKVEFIMEEQGLGSMPAVVPTIGSLLLFNSDINPYVNYQTLDNLISSGRLVK